MRITNFDTTPDAEAVAAVPETMKKVLLSGTTDRASRISGHFPSNTLIVDKEGLVS